ncbi:hypothetical protein CVT24_003914 [Panaeolus cyanescens]|uniref:Uncharacterized protein n=1 Tax=Panaeolus cyanescens TaxID=181874 RepID=A0A409VVC0_9AGAR|nr:hypothetical protein CVT24_003914 [Panaeolus cyanescens]
MPLLDAIYTRLGVPIPRPPTPTDHHRRSANDIDDANRPTTSLTSIPPTSPFAQIAMGTSSHPPSTTGSVPYASSTTPLAPSFPHRPKPSDPHTFDPCNKGLIALFGVVTVGVTLGFAVKDGWARSYFSFFTYLTFTGITGYYIAATVHTVSYYLSSRRGKKGYLLQRLGRRGCATTGNGTGKAKGKGKGNGLGDEEGGIALQRTYTRRASVGEKTQTIGSDANAHSERGIGKNDNIDEHDDERDPALAMAFEVAWWARALQAAHVVLASTVVTYPVIVTAVFWALLAGEGTFSNPGESYNNISVHGLNALFALFEMVLTNSPPIPWVTLVFGILGMGGYLGVAYLTKATQGFYSEFLYASLPSMTVVVFTMTSSILDSISCAD